MSDENPLDKKVRKYFSKFVVEQQNNLAKSYSSNNHFVS